MADFADAVVESASAALFGLEKDFNPFDQDLDDEDLSEEERQFRDFQRMRREGIENWRSCTTFIQWLSALIFALCVGSHFDEAGKGGSGSDKYPGLSEQDRQAIYDLEHRVDLSAQERQALQDLYHLEESERRELENRIDYFFYIDFLLFKVTPVYFFFYSLWFLYRKGEENGISGGAKMMCKKCGSDQCAVVSVPGGGSKRDGAQKGGGQKGGQNVKKQRRLS